MKPWTITKIGEHFIIKPDFEVKCPVCGHKAILHDFRASEHSTEHFYHCDVHFKCINCSFFMTFGVPLSREEYEKLSNSKLNGKILKEAELLDLKEVEKRLKSWGYW